MRNIGPTAIIALAVTLLAGSAYLSLQMWGTPTAEPQVIRIGVISPCTSLYDSVKTLMGLAEEDISSYYEGQGRDVAITFDVANAGGSSDAHLEKVKEFKAQGINVIIGGAWSSQARASMPYVNENGMLLFSPSSTATDQAIPGDNLFRLCPDDAVQGRVISEALWSWGVKALIVIQRDDAWADGIYDALSQGFTGMGGVVAERVRYDPAVTDFSGCLDLAEEAAQEAIDLYGLDHVTVEVLGLHEAADLAAAARAYPAVYSLSWFGSEGTAHNIALSGNAPEDADHLKVLSPLASPAETQSIEALRDRYQSSSGRTLDAHQAEFYAANWYDAAWICAKAVLEAGTTDADMVKEALPRVADDNYTTGPCRLNSAGDRETADYVIWGYALVDGGCEDVRYGLYDGLKGEVVWDTENLGFSPPGHR